MDTDPIWCHLASESIKRFRSIESESRKATCESLNRLPYEAASLKFISDLNFFIENGYLDLFKRDDANLKTCRTIAQSLNVNFIELPDVESIRARFPFMNPSPNMVGLFEPSKSGSLHPRLLTAAQQRLALKRGVVLLRDIVVKVARTPSGSFQIQTKSNREIITADKVILCAGAFLFHNNLLSKYINLDVYPRLIRVARIPLDEQLVKKFNGMPSVSLMTTRDKDANPCNNKFYLMAPVKYPDGK